MSKQYYKNCQGVSFEIEFLTADVPADADYYGYLFKVIADDDLEKVHVYKALVKKSLCESEQAARMWLNSTAFDFLKTILETYNNGRTLLLLPDSKGQWYVI